MSYIEELKSRIQKIEQGGNEKYHARNEENGKLFVRKRLELLFDDDLDIEDAFFANCMDDSLPSDGVVTGIGKVNGQSVCVMANDSTVKAGSWGKRTVERSEEHTSELQSRGQLVCRLLLETKQLEALQRQS